MYSVLLFEAFLNFMSYLLLVNNVGFVPRVASSNFTTMVESRNTNKTNSSSKTILGVPPHEAVGIVI